MVSIRVSNEEAGSIGLSDTYRAALGVTPGDEVVVTVQDNEIRVIPKVEALRRIQQMVREQVAPERSLAEELARERREEAARE
jgi:antitoxin component of MazEF toxin-antitoxin module